MDLTPEETRTVVENLLGIQVYSQMLDKAKVILKEHKDKLKILEKDHSMYTTMITENKNTAEKLERMKDNFEATKIIKTKELLYTQKVLTGEIKSDISELEKLKVLNKPEEPDYIELDNFIKQHENDISKLQEQIINHRKEVKSDEDKIKFFETTELCPICDSTLDEKHKKKELDKINEDMMVATIYIEQKTEFVSIAKVALSGYISTRKTLRDKYVDANLIYEVDLRVYNTLSSDIEKKKIKLENVNSQISDWEKRTLDDLDEVMNDKVLKEYETKLADVFTDVEKTKEEIQYYEFIKELLSDEGIKSQVIKNDLPMLNKTINEYLKDFERTYTITFDEQFNLTLGGYSKRGLSYYNLSEGEKKRIDVSILLAFVRLARLKNSISCNILAFDELLETSLDEDGKEVLVNKLLTNMIKGGIIDNIFVISHNRQLILPDSQKILVYKEGEFSKVKFDA